MSDNSCNSRSWRLMKSCFPNPQHPPPYYHPTAAARGTSVTTISALPDELLLECLSRVSHSSLPCLPLVCSRWSHLVDSPSFYLLRHRLNLLRFTLFALSTSSDDSATLFTATLDDTTPASSWKLSSFYDQRYCGSMLSHSPRLSAIGRNVYVIGREVMLRYDTWTGTVVPSQGPHFPRKKFAAAAVADKIYVAGGCATAVEEYDPNSDTWRVVAHAPRKRYGCVGASVDGVFYIIGGLKIGNEARGSHHHRAHVYASSMDLYDVDNAAWLKRRAVPGGGCVVAACAAATGGEIYLLCSHAVELSFWKFNGSRRHRGFGEWCRIKSSSLLAQVRLDSRVRFNCACIGEKVVVMIQQSMNQVGLVLVYDCIAGEWSRGPDLPDLIRRPTCVCVHC